MNIRHSLILALLAVSLSGYSQRYTVTGITCSRLLVDNRYDKHPNAEAAAFMEPYKAQVDSVMSPVVGTIDHYMEVHQPESDLSNLLADILVWGGHAYNEKPDVGIYNMGGIRAAFSKGDVTYGDVLDVAPFENKICFLTLSGEKLLQLFGEIAAMGGQGVSHGVELVISSDHKLLSARLHGKTIDPKATYRISTIDYLAHGNDGFNAFKDKTDFVSPQDADSNARAVIERYFRAYAADGKAVNSQVEGRIVIK